MLTNTYTFPLPAFQLPKLPNITIGQCYLRPLSLADEPMAFILSKIAFLSAENLLNDTDMQLRQQLWQTSGRVWSGWLHHQSLGSAWAVVCGENGPVVGYARVIRHKEHRLETLTELYVHPLFQHAKIGKTLLAAALEQQVPEGWTRTIIADPNFTALALYYNWGTYPVGTAWYVEPDFQPADIEQIKQQWPSDTYSVRLYDSRCDRSAIDTLDQQIFQRTRSNEHQFFEQSTLYKQVVLLRNQQLVGYGFRSTGKIGPVIATTPQEVLYLVQYHIIQAAQHHEATLGLWVPNQNTTVLHWMRTHAQRVYLLGAISIMLSYPLFGSFLDSYILNSPPFLL